jgi:hypothetical protein
VDPLNSVQLSNHTGYASFKGQVHRRGAGGRQSTGCLRLRVVVTHQRLKDGASPLAPPLPRAQKLGGPDLDAVVEGLGANGLLGSYTHVLTGYVGSETFLRAIVGAVRQVRAANPGAVYVCDPVLGDNGRLYVPPELVPVYRSEVLPLASMLTPNQFEAELLSGVAVTDVPSALAAIDALHARGVASVVMTSSSVSLARSSSSGSGGARRVVADPATLHSEQRAVGGGSSDGEDGGNTMLLIASVPWEAVADDLDRVWGAGAAAARVAAAGGGAGPHKARFCVEIPRLAADFTGACGSASLYGSWCYALGARRPLCSARTLTVPERPVTPPPPGCLTQALAT